MKVCLAGICLIMGSTAFATAGTMVLPTVENQIVFHEAKMDDKNCHTAKRKRHDYHCHEVKSPVADEVDVTEAPSDTEVAIATK